jgi:hypothetical protein
MGLGTKKRVKREQTRIMDPPKKIMTRVFAK